MASINLQFSRLDDLGSEVIQAFDHGAYSHVDAVLGDGRLFGARDDQIGSIPKGIWPRPANYLPFTATKKVALNVPAIVSIKFYGFLNDQTGKGYDEVAILGFVFNRDWSDPDSDFCSELIDKALQISGFWLHRLATAANKITPTDLLLALSAVQDI